MIEEEIEPIEKKKSRKNKRSNNPDYDSKKALALRGLRKKIGLSMAQVAEKVGCSVSTINLLEQGRMDIPRKSEIFDRILELYGTNRKRFSDTAARWKHELTDMEYIGQRLPKLKAADIQFIKQYIESRLQFKSVE
jgi:transcriptional regulator with XRE-family HTH domain